MTRRESTDGDRACQRWAIALVTLALAASACGRATVRPASDETPHRIVSMAPAITELLFALGLGDRVVGVTRFCAYPPEARSRTRVGGYLDPSIEAIVALEPDLVVVMQDQDELRARLERLGQTTLELDQHDVAAILASVTTLADACRVEVRGRELRTTIERRLDRVATAVAGLPRPRVVVVVGREVGHGRVTSVWAAGRDTFYDDLLRFAGGVNELGASAIPYPELAREALIELAPDLVLDLVPDLAERGVGEEEARADWRGLSELEAVAAGRVRLLTDPTLVIPGPRVGEAVATLAQAIHPGLELDE